MLEGKEEFDNVDVKKLIEEVSNLKQDKVNLVEELKGLRTSRQEIEKRVSEVEKKAADDLSKFASDDKQKKLDSAKKIAEDKFKSKYKEFHPDNDTGGLKYQALVKELELRKLDGVDTEDGFLSAFEDAAILLSQRGKQVKSNLNGRFAESPRGGSGDNKSIDDSGLDAREVKLLKMQGWDAERYLKIKTKRPEYVESLLRFMS